MNLFDCLFLDIGGVLLSDGWGHQARRKAVKKFGLKWSEIEERHKATVGPYEEGKLSIEEYLKLVVFYRKRSFTMSQYRKFMFEQSTANQKIISLIIEFKHKYNLKVHVVSNEARELNLHRIRKFKLDSFVDSFISSCYVQLRKPDPDMFRLALDISQARPNKIIYIENTPMFTQVAESFGIQCILHTDYASTREKLNSLGLR